MLKQIADKGNQMAKTITIQGLNFDVSAPYSEGHSLTEAEARALNQTRAENIRNNMAKTIKEAKEKHGETLPAEVAEELRAAVAKYDTEYEFTLNVGGGGARVTDPVEAEAIKIARAAIRAQAKKEGKRILKADATPESDKDVTKARFDELVSAIAQREDVMKLARKRVKEQAGLITDIAAE